MKLSKQAVMPGVVAASLIFAGAAQANELTSEEKAQNSVEAIACVENNYRSDIDSLLPHVAGQIEGDDTFFALSMIFSKTFAECIYEAADLEKPLIFRPFNPMMLMTFEMLGASEDAGRVLEQNFNVRQVTDHLDSVHADIEGYFNGALEEVRAPSLD